MHRRELLKLAGATLAAGLLPRVVAAQPQPQPPSQPLRFADMHTHLGLKPGYPMRESMARNGLLVIAEKTIPDGPLLKRFSGRLRSTRDARPGEMRGNFESAFARRREAAAREGLVEIVSAAALDRVLRERMPAMALSAEGADFLEGDLAYLEKARAAGLVHLQLLHYYRASVIGDIATEEPVHGGLTAFGRDLVRSCNRLGMLIDVAHCTTAGIEQVLEISTKPVIYSHGQDSTRLPDPGRGVTGARAIYAPLAKALAQQGGVIGLWPLWHSFAHIDLYADEIARLAGVYGARHVGIGTDMFGLTRSVVPDYDAFALLPELLSRRGMQAADIDAVLGGNYLRVLRQALAGG